MRGTTNGGLLRPAPSGGITRRMTAWLYILLVALAVCLVALCLWRAVTRARTPQGAVAWVVFLLAAPWFAVPSFAIFGHGKLRAYAASRQNSQRIVQALNAFEEEHPSRLTPTGDQRIFERISGLPMVGGNRVELLQDGEATFDAIFAAIDGAADYVCIQFYTISDDGLGRALADRLEAAAARGVKVMITYDGVGSYGLARGWVERLTTAGAVVVDPRSARGPTSRLELNFRNHRKTVIVDGRKAFVGGHNVSDLYIGRDRHFPHWRDTHVRVEGPVVTQLQLVFAEDWHWASGETLDVPLEWTPKEAEGADLSALVVPTGPGDALDTGSLLYFAAIERARERVWIASPYFVPDAEVLAALTAAALRGCDVRLLIPDRPDHYPPWLAAFAYFDELRAVGVEIHRYEDGFMHQKVFLMDRDLAAVGSANLDNRSFRLNFETMLLVWDEGFAGEVEAMLNADFERSHLMTRDLSDQPLWIRAGAPLCRLVAPIL